MAGIKWMNNVSTFHPSIFSLLQKRVSLRFADTYKLFTHKLSSSLNGDFPNESKWSSMSTIWSSSPLLRASLKAFTISFPTSTATERWKVLAPPQSLRNALSAWSSLSFSRLLLTFGTEKWTKVYYMGGGQPHFTYNQISLSLMPFTKLHNSMKRQTTQLPMNVLTSRNSAPPSPPPSLPFANMISTLSQSLCGALVGTCPSTTAAE